MNLRHLQGPLYMVGVLLLLVPLIDYATNVWPFRLGDLQWRYGSVGLLSGYLITPLLGAALVTLMTGLRGDRRMARVFGVLFLLGGLVLLAAIGVFTLDVLQLRSAVDQERRIVIEIGSARAALKNLLFAVAFIWLGIASFREKHGEPWRDSRHGSPESYQNVVGKGT